MSVTATVEVTLATTQWPRHPAEQDDQGTSNTVPDAHAVTGQVVDNPSPEEKLAAELASAKTHQLTSRHAIAIMATAATVVALVVTLWNSLFVVNNGEVAIVSFGGNVGSVYDSGAHLKAPWETVERFSTSFQTSTWSSAPSSNDGGNGSIITTTRDSVWVNIDLQVTYRLRNLDNIETNWRNYGSQDVLRARVNTTIERATQTAFLGFTATEIWQRDARIEQAVQAEVGAQLKARFGIELDNVVITDCTFNEEVTRGLNAQASVMSVKG